VRGKAEKAGQVIRENGDEPGRSPSRASFGVNMGWREKRDK
jgi:hypothetical protein